MVYDFLYNGKIHKVDIENRNKELTVKVKDEEFRIDKQHISPQVLSLIIDNHSYKIHHARNGNDLYINIKGEIFTFQIPGDDEDILEEKGKVKGEQELLIKSSMPGSILKIEVKEDDRIEEGQCLIIVEAMKMETSLYSTISGKVKKIYTEPGKQIDSGEVLIELEKIK